VIDGRERWCVVTGDCRELLLSTPPVDHVICDPPYEVEAHTLQRRIKASESRGATWSRTGGVVVVEPLDFEPMTEADRVLVGAEIARLSRRWAIIFCQVEAAMLWRASVALDYVRTQIWVKLDPQPQLTGDRPAMGYESIVTMHPKGRKKWNGGGCAGVYHHLKNPSERTHEHPTEKPLALMLDLVRLFTDPGDVILDPYCGSGTTLVAALRLGRRAIGFELNEKYADLARERCAAEARGLTLADVRAKQESLFG
jgi:site-specific DNA-methyltransferase (adenine-specific)